MEREEIQTTVLPSELTSAGAINPRARGESSQFASPTIFRAPFGIRYSRVSDFEPKLVSIGPYFHGRDHLLPMEDLKLQCISDILGDPLGDVPVDRFLSPGWRTHDYYKDNVEYSNDEFVRMLVVDSFFIIRLILPFSQEDQEEEGMSRMTFLDVDIKEVRSDLLLLENQIPLFFIRKVYEWILTVNIRPLPPFETVLEKFISLDMPWEFNVNVLIEDPAHLLDIYWRSSLSPNIIKPEGFFRSIRQQRAIRAEIHDLKPKMIPNASALNKRAGVKFKRHRGGLDVLFKGHWGGLDVFFPKGIMQMPCLTIDSNQTRLLVNLIAFENFKPPHMRIYNSYMKLMDELVDSANDVELLQQCGIIYNRLSSHKMAVKFFKDIGNICLVDYNQHCFSDLYENVQKYYFSSGWKKRWASLRQTYFSSPWAVILVVGGSALLLRGRIK